MEHVTTSSEYWNAEPNLSEELTLFSEPLFNSSRTETVEPKPSLNLALLGSGETVDALHLERIAPHTPPPSGRWKPIAFVDVVDCLRDAVKDAGFRILQEKHKLSKFTDAAPLGAHYFGMFELGGLGDRRDMSTIIGLRQSHDKTLAAAMCAGDAPLVCSNLEFSAEFMLSRKNTINASQGLAQRMAEILECVAESKRSRNAQIERMEATPLTNGTAHHLAAKAYRAGAVNATGLAKVIDQWHTPEHDAFKPRNVWSFSNAFTNVWRGAPQYTAERTRALKQVIAEVL